MTPEIPIRTKPYITEHRVYSSDEALLYITDCTLATVSHMATLKYKSKSEYLRQIGIAQKAIDWIYQMKIPVDKASRVFEVMQDFDINVSKWAKNQEI